MKYGGRGGAEGGGVNHDNVGTAPLGNSGAGEDGVEVHEVGETELRGGGDVLEIEIILVTSRKVAMESKTFIAVAFSPSHYIHISTVIFHSSSHLLKSRCTSGACLHGVIP